MQDREHKREMPKADAGEQRKVSQDRERNPHPDGRPTEEYKAEHGLVQPYDLDKGFSEQEASWRHHQTSLAEQPELDPQQSIPGPLRNPEPTGLQSEHIPWREQTGHKS